MFLRVLDTVKIALVKDHLIRSEFGIPGKHSLDNQHLCQRFATICDLAIAWRVAFREAGKETIISFRPDSCTAVGKNGLKKTLHTGFLQMTWAVKIFFLRTSGVELKKKETK